MRARVQKKVRKYEWKCKKTRPFVRWNLRCWNRTKEKAVQWKILLLPFLYVCLICGLLSPLSSLIQYLSCSCSMMFMQWGKEAICQLRVMVLTPCLVQVEGTVQCFSLSEWTTVHKTLPFLSCMLSSGCGTFCLCLCVCLSHVLGFMMSLQLSIHKVRSGEALPL